MTGRWPEKDWFEKADQDLEMARRALGPGKPLPEMACCHAQQCAEKYLKGYLIAHSVPFRFVPDLVYLTQLCTARESAFGELMLVAEILGEYAATTRYPMEGTEEPDIEAGREAIRLAEQVATFVLQQEWIRHQMAKYPLEQMRFWKPTTPPNQSDAGLWVPIHRGLKTLKALTYLGGIQKKAEILMQEVVEDPIGWTGIKDPQMAVQHLLQQNIGVETVQDIFLEGTTPADWAAQMIEAIDAGNNQGWLLIYEVIPPQAQQNNVRYRPVPMTRENRAMIEEETFETFLQALMHRET